MEKVNQHSGVEVSSVDFEQVVSTNIERDIENELVLAPLFREIPMSSANMIIPILPDAGYAEFTANQAATGSSPYGNLETRGDTYGAPGRIMDEVGDKNLVFVDGYQQSLDAVAEIKWERIGAFPNPISQ